MAQLTFNSAGVGTNEIDLTGPVAIQPVGVPAGVVGTALKGPAFVPITVGIVDDFYKKFGTTDGKKFGPLAVSEWLKNAQSVTFLRVLGVGTGEKRLTGGDNPGSVTSAGFVVGENEPNAIGSLVANPFANTGGPPGRTYLLGCYMSESLDSTVFSDAGLQGVNAVIPDITSSVPIIRGILFAASGVIPRLSSSRSNFSSAAPASTYVAVNSTTNGAITGTVKLLESAVSKQEFVMLLNGHKGTDANYPNVITASFDPTAQNYFSKVFNRNPFKYQDAGHYLYANYDIHPSLAVVTGTGLIGQRYGASGASGSAGLESAAFLTTGAFPRNQGSSVVPDYENFEDRFNAPRSPYVISQKFGGSPADLFKVESLDDGDYAQKKVKISIENIAASTDDNNRYGSFDLLVRDIKDRDEEKIVLEEWRGLNLNPSSDRYAPRVIGDQKVYFDFDKSKSSQKIIVDGDYPNQSNLIRVIPSDKLKAEEVDATALPMGVRGIFHLVSSGSQPLTTIGQDTGITINCENALANILKRAVQAPLPLRKSVVNGTGAKKVVNSKLYWGVQFEFADSVSDPNKSTLFDDSILSFAKYLPNFHTSNQNVVVGDNAGAADTTANAILDADRFNNNIFTLENVQVTTGSDTNPNMTTVADWTYVRPGNIVANAVNKTRALSATDLEQQSVRSYAKFSFLLQGGFDGVNVFDEDEANLTNVSIVEEMNNTNRGENNGPIVSAHKKALDIMKNTSEVDIKLLAIPGIRHAVITDEAIQTTEDRFDAMYIMDIEGYDSLNSLITGSNQDVHVSNTVVNFTNRNLDSNFAAAYFPDVIMTDPTLKTLVQVPPSVAVLGAFALNDAKAFPWFAPAGFVRGALASVTEAVVKLSRANLDQVYSADINPLVAFPSTSGVVVWGQKTLQKAQTALDRVNVRRLLIEIRRQAREVGNTLLFEPNRASTLARFAAAMNPRLKSIQSRSGVERFKVILDTTTTSQLDVENNTVRGKIFIQPTRTAEFISLDFVVANQGAQIT